MALFQIENYTVSYVQALFQDLGEYENPIRFDYNQGRQKTTAGLWNNNFAGEKRGKKEKKKEKEISFQKIIKIDE